MTTPQPIQQQRSAYAQAGVDIDSKLAGIERIKKMAAETKTPGVVGGIGSFGGLFASPGSQNLLVASTDGVGTKLKVAVMAKKHDTVGQDIVNHCVNDILVQGARPLFFLDYIGASRFDAEVFQEIVAGLCKACRENGCALLGGETAEMPGLYPAGEYDLVGTIVGVVDRRDLITGEKIRGGDAVIGLHSGGLQTNGFSLARRVIFDQCGLAPGDLLPGTRTTVSDALLAVHRSFLKPVAALSGRLPVHGMAHITGGGFVDNIPRVLPEDCRAVLDRDSWEPPEIFSFIQEQGKVSKDEMYRVFNMGIGFVVIVDRKDADEALGIFEREGQGAALIGFIEEGGRGVLYRDGGAGSSV